MVAINCRKDIVGGGKGNSRRTGEEIVKRY